MIRLYSTQGMSYLNPYRTAKVNFKYYTDKAHETTSTYTIIYNENLEDTRPTLKLVATLANTQTYIHLDATKNHGALMNSDTWKVTAYMKFVNANGDFINRTSEYDLKYDLEGAIDNDTLTYDVQQKPEITSDVVGCKIVSVFTDSFQYYVDEEHKGPEISFVTRNVWAKPIVAKTYTFGNATITKMKVNKWDDLEMKIQFDIVPGTTTNIPYGASVQELLSTGDGKRTFKFFRGSSSYDWTKYYDKCSFTASTWDTCGTTVTFTFTNEVATGLYSSYNSYGGKQISNYAYLNTSLNQYETVSTPLSHIYSADILQVSISNKKRAIPALDYFGHIRFWFALSATYNGTTTSTNFEVSTNGLSDKIGTGNQNYKYNVPIETNLAIINGYYKLAISTHHISNIGNVLANTTEFAKTVAELKTSIDELKVVESAAVLTGVSKTFDTSNVLSNVTKNSGITLVSNVANTKSVNTKSINTKSINTKTTNTKFVK